MSSATLIKMKAYLAFVMSAFQNLAKVWKNWRLVLTRRSILLTLKTLFLTGSRQTRLRQAFELYSVMLCYFDDHVQSEILQSIGPQHTWGITQNYNFDKSCLGAAIQKILFSSRRLVFSSGSWYEKWCFTTASNAWDFAQFMTDLDNVLLCAGIATHNLIITESCDLQ